MIGPRKRSNFNKKWLLKKLLNIDKSNQLWLYKIIMIKSNSRVINQDVSKILEKMSFETRLEEEKIF